MLQVNISLKYVFQALSITIADNYMYVFDCVPFTEFL